MGKFLFIYLFYFIYYFFFSNLKIYFSGISVVLLVSFLTSTSLRLKGKVPPVVVLLEVTYCWKILSAIGTSWIFYARHPDVTEAYRKIFNVDNVTLALGNRPSYKWKRIAAVVVTLGALVSQLIEAIIRSGRLSTKEVVLDLFTDGIQFVIHALCLLHFNFYVMVSIQSLGNHIRGGGT